MNKLHRFIWWLHTRYNLGPRHRPHEGLFGPGSCQVCAGWEEYDRACRYGFIRLRDRKKAQQILQEGGEHT